MKTFIAIMLAVTLLACDPDDSSGGGSSEPKPPGPASTCSITQFQDESGKTQAITGGKINNVEKGYTLTFFYDCNIAKKDYGSKAKLEYDDQAIQPSPAEISLPDQAKATGSFTVKGLKVGETNIKIKLEKSDVLTELALNVIPTFDLNPSKVKIEEIPTTGLTLTKGKGVKLELYQDTFYLLQSTGGLADNYVNFYSSPDGKTWTKLPTPQDPTSLNSGGSPNKISGKHFDLTVHDGKLWLAGSNDTPFQGFWNFDGKDWKKVKGGKSMNYFGSVVSYQNTLYHIGGDKYIYAYENDEWKKKYTYKVDNGFGRIDAVVFAGKIWVIGGREITNSGATETPIKTVSSFDGSTYQQVADLSENSWWTAVEIFPRGLLAIAGVKDESTSVTTVFWSRFGTTWTKIDGKITDQNKLKGVMSGSTVLRNGALWAVSREQKVLKITYDE